MLIALTAEDKHITEMFTVLYCTRKRSYHGLPCYREGKVMGGCDCAPVPCPSPHHEQIIPLISPLIIILFAIYYFSLLPWVRRETAGPIPKERKARDITKLSEPAPTWDVVQCRRWGDQMAVPRGLGNPESGRSFPWAWVVWGLSERV